MLVKKVEKFMGAGEGGILFKESPPPPPLAEGEELKVGVAMD